MSANESDASDEKQQEQHVAEPALKGRETNGNPTQQEESHTEKLPIWKDSQWWQVFAAAVLVPFGIYAVIVYSDQLEEMRKATKAATDGLDLTRNIMRIDQRAWVAHTTINGIFEVGKEFAAVVTIKNTGKSFAKNVKFVIRHEMLPNPQQPAFPEDTDAAFTEVESIILLAPDSGTELPTKNDIHVPVTEAQFEAVKAGEDVMFVHGRILYDDIFGCHHWTNFCYKLIPENLRYRTYKTHNDADDNECP